MHWYYELLCGDDTINAYPQDQANYEDRVINEYMDKLDTRLDVMITSQETKHNENRTKEYLT